jgi:ATP-dependent helicase/nuclease subunit A
LQWAIIEHLVEEFHAGEGAERGNRTLFVVGDEKQSIYSFQGADLESFAAVRDRLTRKFAAAGRPLERTVLDLSFRSGPAILEAVDAVLADPLIRAAVAGDAAVGHQTFRRNALSTVEIWPLVEPAERIGRSGEGWQLPTERFDADEAEARLAEAIARTIKGWLDSGQVLEATGAPIRAGDILILLQRRGIAQERILKALKENDIPVAGADRLLLTDSIAVEDLVALGQALLLPEDDLTLAALLKSPLVGLDEDDLFRLAFAREKAHLVDRLRALGERGEAPFAAAWERFRGWLGMADFMPPFELFTRILGPEGGRRRLLQRLGPDAAEPIEAFLAQALAYEDGHPASLQGFIHWLGLDAESLKRDLEQGTDAVRVMTVHGSKGLEAPIVFLAEAGPYQPQGQKDRLLVRSANRPAALARGCRRARPHQPGHRRSARGAAGGRTLAPALCRHDPCPGPPRTSQAGPSVAASPTVPGTTSSAVLSAVSLASSAQASPTGCGWCAASPAARSASPPPWRGPSSRSLPGSTGRHRWSRKGGASSSPRARRRRPCRPARRWPPGAGAARHFGTALHRLLHEVAGQPEADRDAVLEARLAAWPGLDAVARAELTRQVRGVLDLPELAPAFGPQSRSEQPIVGRLGELLIAGQIDRFAVTDEAIFIVDFKSNRLPPARPEAAPAAYLRQLAAYAALLGTLYPNRAIRAGLVWTAVPMLMPIASSLLAAYRPGDIVAA